jgi:hypothetical protein
VINAEGKLWKEQRRFLHEKLRRFGMTHLNSKSTKLQSLIAVSVEEINKRKKNLALKCAKNDRKLIILLLPSLTTIITTCTTTE